MTRRSLPAQRRLHLIDVENLAGTPTPSRDRILRCRQRYLELIRPQAGDHCVIACSHHAGPVVSLAWSDARHIWRSGQDGADLALIDVLTGESVADRFAAVILASGDWLFAAPVAQLGTHGIPVTVVANRGSLSRQLALAAGRVLLFDAGAAPLAAGSAR